MTGALAWGSVILAALVCSWPLWATRVSAPWMVRSPRPSRRLTLREEKATLFLALRELDFDYEMGKISAADYKELKAKYEAKTVAVLKEAETLEREWSTFLEDLAKEIPMREGATPLQNPAAYCPQCGKPLSAQDRFCATCGSTLKAAANA